MKTKNLLFLLLIFGSIFIFFSSFMPYPGGAPSPYYYSGSPGDGHDCSSCHGNASPATGWITSNIPASGYIPGTTYQVTATNSGSGSGKYGFELSPQNNAGQLLGTLAPGTNSKLVGSGKWITHSTSSTSVTSWTFNWTAPVAGTGSVTFYASFTRSEGSATRNSSLTVSEAAVSVPAAAGPITGNTTVCRGTSATFSVGAISGASTYVWSVPAGAEITSGQGTTSINVFFSTGAVSGNISVYGSNSAGNGLPSSLGITVNPLPMQPTEITGPVNICSGATAQYSVENTAGIIYNWSVPAGAVINSGQGTNSIEVTFGLNGGYIELSPSNNCGSGPGRVLFITVRSIPSQPAVMEGPEAPCEGSTVNYAVPNAEGTTFTWTVPSGSSIVSGQGTNSISMLVGPESGEISVTPVNDCGTGPAKTKNIIISEMPLQPGEISGIAEPCQGSTQVYTVENTPGVEYSWGVPSGSEIIDGSGTNSITVVIGPNSGYIELHAVNDCGQSPVRTKYLTIQALPGWTAFISGPSELDPTLTPTSNYSTTGAANATQYEWELTPAEAGTVTGNGLTAVVNWNPGYFGVVIIRVRGSNSCSEGEWSDPKEIHLVLLEGIQEPSKPSFTLYPSPCKNELFIETANLNGKIKASLLNSSGNQLQSFEI
ncbi:MAG: hypothetical protein IPH84_14980 [Bacteroidales bacterium]|nr:hypothetical protein [Bacteroidales bacterium]